MLVQPRGARPHYDAVVLCCTCTVLCPHPHVRDCRSRALALLLASPCAARVGMYTYNVCVCVCVWCGVCNVCVGTAGYQVIVARSRDQSRVQRAASVLAARRGQVLLRQRRKARHTVQVGKRGYLMEEVFCCFVLFCFYAGVMIDKRESTAGNYTIDTHFEGLLGIAGLCRGCVCVSMPTMGVTAY